VAEGGSTDLQVAQGDWRVSAPSDGAGYKLNVCSAV
jgi:hypothetical protein